MYRAHLQRLARLQRDDCHSTDQNDGNVHPFLPAQTTPPLPHPTPAATSASHRKSSHLPETAKSPHRSTHKPAPALPPIPPPHEIPATRAAGETSQSPPNFACRSPRSIHSPAPPRPSPAKVAASAPSPGHKPPTNPQSCTMLVSRRSSTRKTTHPRPAHFTFISNRILS